MNWKRWWAKNTGRSLLTVIYYLKFNQIVVFDVSEAILAHFLCLYLPMPFSDIRKDHAFLRGLEITL